MYAHLVNLVWHSESVASSRQVNASKYKFAHWGMFLLYIYRRDTKHVSAGGTRGRIPSKTCLAITTFRTAEQCERLHHSTALTRRTMLLQVDPAEWRLEVERVAPRLKITVASNARDWRSHLDEAHKHSQEISTIWPGVQTALGAVQTEVSGMLSAPHVRFLQSYCKHS